MRWRDAPGDAPLLRITAGDDIGGPGDELSYAALQSIRVVVVNARGTPVELEAEPYDPDATPVDLLAGGPGSWDGSPILVSKPQLPATSERRPSFLIELSFGESRAPTFVVVQWSEEAPGGLVTLLESYPVVSSEAAVQAQVQEGDEIEAVEYLQCAIEVSAPPAAREHVFLAGANFYRSNVNGVQVYETVDGTPDGKKKLQGGPYRAQIRVLALVQEMGERMTRYAQEVPSALPAESRTRWDDGLVLNVIGADPEDEERTTYARMFPPGEHLPASSDNLADPRRWVQWYAVFRVGHADDPRTAGRRGIARAYEYLRWVAANAPGRVHQMAFVSHAWTGGPSCIYAGVRELGFPVGDNGGGAVGDFNAGGRAAGILGALAPRARYWVTGCNANGSDFGLGDRQLASVEGTLRARIRLKRGLSEALAFLEVEEDTDRARAVLVELLQAHEDDDGAQAWQVAGRTGQHEGVLADREVGQPLRDERTGRQILTLPDGVGGTVGDRIRRLAAWMMDVAALPDEAFEHLRLILDALEWETFQDLVVPARSMSIARRIRIARTAMSAVAERIEGTNIPAHYAAAFALMARKATPPRTDIVSLGGNPGLGAEHLDVWIHLWGLDGLGNLAYKVMDGERHTGQISSYFRNPHESRTWLLAFYRRLGQYQTDILGYFRYEDKIDDAGLYAPRFDSETLHLAD